MINLLSVNVIFWKRANIFLSSYHHVAIAMATWPQLWSHCILFIFSSIRIQLISEVMKLETTNPTSPPLSLIVIEIRARVRDRDLHTTNNLQQIIIVWYLIHVVYFIFVARNFHVFIYPPVYHWNKAKIQLTG